jgi:heavy metal sensor kinase
LRSWIDRLGHGRELAAAAFDPAGQLVAGSEHLTAIVRSGQLAPATAHGGALQFDTLQLPALGHVRRLTAEMTAGGNSFVVMLLAELEHVDEEMALVAKALLVTLPVTLAAAAALAYWLARKSLAPVEQLRQLTDEITAERLDRRLAVGNPADELGLLAQTINSMIGRLECSFREISRFTADASHELRTPIAVIRSEAEMGLASGEIPEEVKGRLSSILEECSRLTSMTDQLLTLCREDAGILAHSHEPVRLSVLCADAVETMRPLAVAKGQMLAADRLADVTVLGDAERLRLVLYNLIDNAIKYTPQGGRAELSIDRRGNEAVIAVRDTGTGIAAEHLPHLFDRFFRVDKSQSLRHGGFGLGLSIVKSIVAAHGGRVEVESSGKGSEFRVCLPLPNA